MEKADGIEANIGTTLRRVRKAVGLTLESAARQADVTKGYLSKVESGQAMPSTRVLVRLADVFGVPLSEILMPEGERRPLSIVRAGERPTINRNGSDRGYLYELASRGKLNPRAEVFFLTLPVLDEDTHPRFKHSGEEVIFVLEGKMRFHYGGVDIVAGPGDCLQFDSSIEHYARAEDGEAARLFVVNIPGRFERTRSST